MHQHHNTNNQLHNQESPIFIVGSVRSGTSIVARALMRGAGIPGYTEGCFIDFLGAFMNTIEHNYERRPLQRSNPNVMLGSIPQQNVRADMLTWFKKQYDRYNPFHGTWVDKTADKDAIRAMQHVHALWPNAKVIFMKRRPIETITSRCKKFPNVSFFDHCTLWAEIYTIMQDVLQRMPQASYILLDQYDVSTKPNEVARTLGAFLHLSVQQIEQVERVLREDRPESTGGDETTVQSLDMQSWTLEEKEYFKNTCGEHVEQMGWSLEDQYYKV